MGKKLPDTYNNQLTDAYNEVSKARLKEIKDQLDATLPSGIFGISKKDDKAATAFYDTLETLGEEVAMKKMILKKLFPTQKERLTGLLAIADEYEPRDQFEICMRFLAFLPKDTMTRNGLLQRALDTTRYTGFSQEAAVQWVYDEAEEGSAIKDEAAIYRKGLKFSDSEPDEKYNITNIEHPLDF